MTVRQANIKGIKFLEEPNGSEKGGVALITFDLPVAYTASADTVKLGGGGKENGVTTTAALATMIQNRRRDGKTVTLTGVGGPVTPGIQSDATNGPLLYTELAAVNGANVDSIKLFSAVLGGGSECTCTTTAWTQPASIVVTYTAA